MGMNEAQSPTLPSRPEEASLRTGDTVSAQVIHIIVTLMRTVAAEKTGCSRQGQKRVKQQDRETESGH